MKSRVGAILTLFVLIASPSFAQSVTTFGAKAGLNLDDLSFDPAEGCCEMKTGLAIGGFVDMGLRGTWSFQPEVLFMQKGAEDTGRSQAATISLDFIEIPLLMKANFQASGRSRPFVVVGPGIGFKTSAKVEDQDIGDEVDSSEFSVIFGGGVTLGSAIIEARYDLGLSDLASDTNGTAKSRTFSILAGYSFNR